VSGTANAEPPVDAASSPASAGGGRTTPTEPSRMPPWVPRLVLYVALVGTAAVFAIMLLRQLTGLIWIMVIALFLSFALEPAVNWFSKHRWTRFWATSFILALLLLATVGIAAVFVPLFVAQVGSLVQFVGDVINTLNPLLQKWFGHSISLDSITDWIPQIAQAGLGLLGGVVGIVGSLASFVGRALAVAFFAFFLVADGPKFRRYICSFLPPDRQQKVLWTWDTALDKTGSYFYSRLLQALIAGGTAFVVMAILRVPFALPLALWVGLISQFIPAVGSYIAAILPLLIALFVSLPTFLILGGWFLLYQLIENYIISPKITAHTMELHPAVALGSAFAGGALFGAIGAFLALPAAAVIQAGVSNYSRRYDVVEDELTTESPSASDRDQEQADA